MSRATEGELVIVAPAMLLGVHSWLHLAAAVCSRAARTHHAEPGVLERVESLLDERVFEEEARRVAVRGAAVWISTLVQRVSEHLAADRHATADEDSRDLAKLDVCQAVSSELERAAVSDQDEPRFAALGPAAGRCHAQTRPVGHQSGSADVLQHAAETVILRLVAKSASLAERLWKDELATAQVVEDVAEQSVVM